MSNNIIPEIYWLEFDDYDISGTTIINRATNASSYTATIPSGVDICLNTIESIEGSGSLQLNNPDGTGAINYIQLSSVTAPTSFTISMWVKPNIDDPNHLFYQFNTGSYDNNNGLYIGIKENKWDLRIGGNILLGNDLFPKDGYWHNITLVYNSGISNLYVDTVAIISNYSSTITGNIFNHLIGSASWLGIYRHAALTGYMDDFRFYDRALSTTEITTIYNYVKTVNYTATISNGSLYLKKFTGRAILNPAITFRAGFTYIFDQSDSSNINSQIAFSKSSTFTTLFTSSDGVVTSGIPGQAGAYTTLTLPNTFTGTLYYSSYSIMTVIPAPATFTSNTLTVTGQSGANSFKNGTYIAAASSYDSNSSFFPYKAFNNVDTTNYCWASAYELAGNYTQMPYYGVPVSTYRGGGNSVYYYTTIIDDISYAGEWLQIQLPYQFLLTSYSIKTRKGYFWPTRGLKKFYIAGSNNGFTWHMADTQDLGNTPPSGTTTTVTFNASTTNRFSYYRIIVNEVYNESINYPNMLAEIGSWNLYGQYYPVLPITYNVTISNGVYSLQQLTPTIENIQAQPFIQFEQGKTYIIHYPTAYPLALSETKNGTWASGTPYTTGVTNDTTNGKLTLVMSEYKTLYYYGTTASDMGYNPTTDFSANHVNTPCILSNYVNSVTMCCSKDAKIVWIFNVNNFGLYMSTNYGYTFRIIPFSTTLINTANSWPSQLCCDDTGFIMYMTYNKTTTYKFNKATYTMDSVTYMTNTMAVAITGDGNTLYGLNPTGNKLKKYIVSTSTDLSYNTNYTTNADAPFSFTMDSTGTYLAACGDATVNSNKSILMISNNGGLNWSSPAISTTASGVEAYYGCAKYNYTGTVLCVSYGGTTDAWAGPIFISYDRGITFTNLNTLNVYNCLGNNGRTGGPAIHIDANGTNFIFMDRNSIVQYNKTTNTTTTLNSTLGVNPYGYGGIVCGDIYGTRFVFSYSNGSQTYFKTMERPNIYNPNNNFNSIASTAKVYYSGDYGVVKSTTNNNITTWKNRIAGGVDAIANTTNASGYYPTHVSTYSGATFNNNMIQLNNGLNNYIGFNSAGGAKLASEPVEQTFVIFGYFSGTAADNQIMSKIGAYDGTSNSQNGTPHTGFNGGNRAYIITSYDVDENPAQYYVMPPTSSGAPKVSGGYFLFSYTAITDSTQASGTYRTILNVKVYPNVDLGTTKSVYNTTKESILHDFELGYWSVSGRSFRGTFGEFMYFNRKLTDNERFILEGKIAWKYGQAAILPANHPYKTAAPLDAVISSISFTSPTTTNPTITNFTIPTKQYGAAAFTLTPPTSDSSGAFTYTSANTSVATIAGNTVTILSIGSTVITATQAALGSYGTGTITATLTVSKVTPTITNFSIEDKKFGDAPFTLTAPTSNSTGAFTYTSDNTSVATIASNTVTVIGGGTTTITATQAETTNYAAATITAILTVTIDPICFLRGTKIMCLDEEAGGDTEVEIENLRPGNFIKTYKHGYVPVNCIGYSMLPNPTNPDERIKDRLYKLTPEQYPTLTRELIITGCHAILEDELTETQREQTLRILEDIYITDDKYRLIAMIDERTEIYETKEEESEIWHLCLENEYDNRNYGIYANGLLVESCCKCNLERVNLVVPP